MHREQIISTAPDQEAHDRIRRQYQSDLQVLGEREALEFACFRCAALADATEQDARQAKQSFRRALIIGAICAALAFAVGFMIGRAHQPQPAKQALSIARPLPCPPTPIRGQA